MLVYIPLLLRNNEMLRHTPELLLTDEMLDDILFCYSMMTCYHMFIKNVMLMLCYIPHVLVKGEMLTDLPHLLLEDKILGNLPQLLYKDKIQGHTLIWCSRMKC